MILGQLRTENKSNEISAIPELLKQLTLPVGCVVTIDAAGTQKENADLLREMWVDYALALKSNHFNLRDEWRTTSFKLRKQDKSMAPLDECMSEERGHGRSEYRRVSATDDLAWLEQKSEWRDMRSIVRLETMRRIGGRYEQETRYYITSLPQTLRS
jgi:predicted transposase YbfD/YdcC